MDRYVIGGHVDITTVTVVQKRVRVANLSIEVSSTLYREDIVIPPREVFIQPFVSDRDSVMTIRIRVHGRASLAVFIAIESRGELMLFKPSQLKEEHNVLIYRVPIPSGIGAVVLANQGLDRAVVDLEIDIG
ncbi:MAG TPA: hypothetical protein EYH02_03575 [Ignisphaera aggregans]|uniref:Uncharacterized protein n=1 Tax=Ignisphaera aggregans TaxID=334771 RepID=A0A832YXX1_9CREN|nr:hypothetical protein [Ignisphaera aggregans]